MKTLLALSLILASPSAFAKTVNLSSGESIKIGNTKVTCGEEEEAPAPVKEISWSCYNKVFSGFYGAAQPSEHEARRDVFGKCRSGGVNPYKATNFTSDDEKNKVCQQVADDATCSQ